MNSRLFCISALLLAPLLWAQPAGRAGAPPPPKGRPPAELKPKAAAASDFPDESLPYLINWPSGLSLGEAVLSLKKLKSPAGEERLRLELRLNAAVPGFAVMDVFRSEATADYCSAEFIRTTSHGKKKGEEKITFDQKHKTASRETTGGGKSEIAIPACAKDALAFLYYARRELKLGRVPPAGAVYYGGAYQVRLEFTGTQSIRLGDAMVETEKVAGTIKGPVSSAKFEAFFARDAVRTPLLVRVPLPVGILSLELSR
jgi:hypothetical protein